MRTTQSYSGYYNGIWVRSSYEYALIKYFEYTNTKYEYEPFIVEFEDGTSYIPDFIANGVVYEVKNNANAYDGHTKIGKLQLECGVQGMVVTYDTLRLLYKTTNINLNKTIKEWKTSPNNKLNSSTHGVKNPRYGLSHAESTKKLISTKAKERMQTPEYRELMQATSWFKTGEVAKLHLTGRQKVERVTITCPTCGGVFQKPPHGVTTYCSRTCANIVSSALGVSAEVANMRVRLAGVKNLVLDWVTTSTEHIINIPYNNVHSNLEVVYEQCFEKFGVKDQRTIAKAFDCKNGKELLKVLKELAENICRAKDELTSCYAEKSLELQDKKLVG